MLFVDSDVLIAHQRGEPNATAFLERLSRSGEHLAVTSINVAELFQGAERAVHREAALASVLSVLDSLVQVPFGPRAARRFGSLMAAMSKAGRPIPEMDGLIAAVVLENGGRIATRNLRHYSRIHALEIVEVE